MLGMIVTDVWKSTRKSCFNSNWQYTITKFVDIVARHLIEYTYQLEDQEDIDQLSSIEAADSPFTSVDPKTTTITHSSSDDSGDTSILSVTYNIGKRCYDIHDNASSMHTPEILSTGKQIR